MNHYPTLKDLIRAIEERAIRRALIANDYNRNETAKSLGMKRTTFVMKCARYRIELKQNPFENVRPGRCEHGKDSLEVAATVRANGKPAPRCAVCAKAQRAAEYAAVKQELKNRRQARKLAWMVSQNFS